jgi:hypothetical protein
MDNLSNVRDKLPYTMRIYPRLSDFFVDVFGTLIPGIIFTAISFIVTLFFSMMVVPIIYNYFVKDSIKRFSIICINDIPTIPTYLYFWFSILFIVASYVFGHIFYRLGPKLPDQKSFKFIYNTIYCDNPVHIIKKINTTHIRNINIKWMRLINKLSYYINTNLLYLISKRRRLVLKESKNLNWPYKDLDKYLYKRSPHLSRMVTWGGKNKADMKPSKIMMNAIKDAIQFHFPEKYGTIARNEGHIRLMSSIWFMSRTIIRMCSILLLITLVISPLYSTNSPKYDKIFYLSNIIIFAIIILLSYWVKRTIERSFHYQRIREIIYILNTAFQARKTKPDFGWEFWPWDITRNGK